jgi:hypothetical protein
MTANVADVLSKNIVDGTLQPGTACIIKSGSSYFSDLNIQIEEMERST